MPVVLVHQGPTLTQERYEETVRRLTDGKSRMDTPADWPVEGLLVHIAGQSESGFRVVDLWESEDALRRFGEKAGAGPTGGRRSRATGDLSGAHVRLSLRLEETDGLSQLNP